MSLTVDTPATIFDMAELAGAATQLHWAVVKEMWSAGETFALRDGPNLIGLFGLYPIEGGVEAWFNVDPAASRHMSFILRQIRLTLASRSYPEIVVLCTSEAGIRIARLVGFRFAERNERGEIWHAKHFGIGQRQGPGQAAGPAATAPHAGGARQAAG